MRTVSLHATRRLGVAVAAALLTMGGARDTMAQPPVGVRGVATSPDGVPIAYEVHGAGESALVLVGHSMGGDVIAEAARRLRGLHPRPRPRDVPPGADRSLVERVAADMASAPPTVAIGAVQHAFGYSREMPRTLQALKLPVVAINPDDGPTDLPSMERHGVRVVIMPGVGHFAMLEDPARFNRILAEVVASLPP